MKFRKKTGKGVMKENSLSPNGLNREGSFMNEVEEFYNFETALGGSFAAKTIEIRMKEEDPTKKGKYPSKDLVESLESFYEKPFDISKLRYDSVREDYQRITNSSRQIINSLINLSTFIGMVGGAAYYAVPGISEGDVYKTIFGGAISVVSTIINCRSRMDTLLKVKGSNGEFTELKKLYQEATKADSYYNKIKK